MTAKDYVGKYAIHQGPRHSWGEVFVKGRPKGSIKMVNIRVTQRGEGWDEATEQYRKVKHVRLNPDECPGAKTITWRTTRRDDYGVEDTVNIDELKLIEDEVHT